MHLLRLSAKGLHKHPHFDRLSPFRCSHDLLKTCE